MEFKGAESRGHPQALLECLAQTVCDLLRSDRRDLLLSETLPLCNAKYNVQSVWINIKSLVQAKILY